MIKTVTPKGVKIPIAAARLSGFQEGEQLELHVQEGAAVLIRKQMTAIELFSTVEALNEIATSLMVQVARACGPCGRCGCEMSDCPVVDSEYVSLPDHLRDSAGIPKESKLCALPDEKHRTVTIMEADYKHDLQDVPPGLLETLRASGICIGELEERLILEDTVYG